MPRPPRFTRDEEGKPYIWEAGENFSLEGITEKVNYFSMDFYKAFGEDATQKYNDLTEETVDLPNELDAKEDDAELTQVFGGYHGFSTKQGIHIDISDEKRVKLYLNDQEVANHKRYLKENRKGIHGLAERLRSSRPKELKGTPTEEQMKEYEKQMHLWNGKKRIADHMERYVNVMDPEKGNYLEALGSRPYMTMFVGLYGSDPCFQKLGFEQCIEGLDQLDIPDASKRVPIFNTYMDMMDAGSAELETEYHRQEMEKTGWDRETWGAKRCLPVCGILKRRVPGHQKWLWEQGAFHSGRGRRLGSRCEKKPDLYGRGACKRERNA